MTPWPDRFWQKVEKGEGCWRWLASSQGTGYGQVKAPGRGNVRLAHRVAYELVKGPIPTGLVIDHLCRNRMCVNPDHLEPVTDAVNIQRGESPSMVTQRTGVCKRGHVLAEVGYATWPGARTCRACSRIRNRATRRRRTPAQIARWRQAKRAYYARNRDRLNALNREYKRRARAKRKEARGV